MVADVKCYLCGAICGSLESERGSLASAATFVAAGGRQGIDVPDWRTLRCARCGGGVFLDDPTLVQRRIERYTWRDDVPRRGRPPKWLSEQRRRERERQGQHAA